MPKVDGEKDDGIDKWWLELETIREIWDSGLKEGKVDEGEEAMDEREGK